jgi:hypothetical protein
MDWDLLVASDLYPGVGALPVGAIAPPSKRWWRGQLWARRAPGGSVVRSHVLQGRGFSIGTRRRGRMAWAGD